MDDKRRNGWGRGWLKWRWRRIDDENDDEEKEKSSFEEKNEKMGKGNVRRRWRGGGRQWEWRLEGEKIKEKKR